MGKITRDIFVWIVPGKYLNMYDGFVDNVMFSCIVYFTKITDT